MYVLALNEYFFPIFLVNRLAMLNGWGVLGLCRLFSFVFVEVLLDFLEDTCTLLLDCLLFCVLVVWEKLNDNVESRTSFAKTMGIYAIRSLF